MQGVESLAGTGTQRQPSGSAGHPFTAVLLDDDGKRASAVSALLSSLAGPDVRLIRMGSPSRPHSMLERILAPVVAAADPARLADNARLIARTIAERQGQEARVVLLIRQAERLQPSVLITTQKTFDVSVDTAVLIPVLEILSLRLGARAFSYDLQPRFGFSAGLSLHL